jgi:hypothetical protein
MSSNRWLLPVLLVLPFAVVAASDVVRLLARHSPEDVSLLESAEPLRFELSAAVVDLRHDPPRAGGSHQHSKLELGPGWGALGPQGRWSEGDRFEVVWIVPVGGQTALFIEGRIDRNQARDSRLAVAVNGRHAGEIQLSRAMTRHALEVADAPLLAGRNRLEFRLLDPSTGAADTSRTTLIRRLAVALDTSRGFPARLQRTPLAVAPDRESVVVRREGRLILPFEVSESGSQLEFRYRFRGPEPDGWARVVVARRYRAPTRYDVARSVTLDAADADAGRFRHVLRDRDEPGALLIWVNAAAARDGFVIKEPRIVVRTRRR